MSFSEMISPLFGRLMLTWFYVNQAMYYGRNWDATLLEMHDKGVPAGPLLLAFSLILIVLGAISLALGFHTKHGALVLFTVTLVSTLLLHNFWRVSDAGIRAEDAQIFARNIAISGGLLFLVGMGSGPLGFDNKAGGGKGGKGGKR